MSATTAMPGDYPVKPYLSDPVWPVVTAGGYHNINYGYVYPWTPTKAEFDALKADIEAIKTTLESQFGKPELAHEPLRAEDV